MVLNRYVKLTILVQVSDGGLACAKPRQICARGSAVCHPMWATSLTPVDIAIDAMIVSKD
jgi:hypothetical protein